MNRIKIVFSRDNDASRNIGKKIIEFGGEAEEFEGSVLEAPSYDKYTTIVLSSHKSKDTTPIFTVHFPGNWTDAMAGGEPNTINIADAILAKSIYQNIGKMNSIKWDISLEADHHGPTTKRSIIFVEMGPRENEWKNEKAAEIMANAVLEAINRKPKTRLESVLCAGEGHYPKTFSKIQMEDETIAVGHLLPKYKILECPRELIIESIEMTYPKAKKILVEKGCNRKQKEKMKEIAEEAEVEFQLV